MHFFTKRFDQDGQTGRKIHMHTLGGLAHFDFNDPGANSYDDHVKNISFLMDRAGV